MQFYTYTDIQHNFVPNSFGDKQQVQRPQEIKGNQVNKKHITRAQHLCPNWSVQQWNTRKKEHYAHMQFFQHSNASWFVNL